jgi:hypothetical protein
MVLINKSGHIKAAKVKCFVYSHSWGFNRLKDMLKVNHLLCTIQYYYKEASYKVFHDCLSHVNARLANTIDHIDIRIPQAMEIGSDEKSTICSSPYNIITKTR